MKSDINKNTRLQRTFNKYLKLNDTDLCILDCYGCSISKKIHPTIMSTYANANNHFLVRQINNKMAKYYKIRKFTPKECFRLMGVEDADIDKLLNSDLSDTQLYKMAGNSIVTNCMTHMFYNLFINRPKKKDIELW